MNTTTTRHTAHSQGISRHLAPEEFTVRSLGPTQRVTPLDKHRYFVRDDEKVLAYSRLRDIRQYSDRGQELPAFELAGPRAKTFFDPAKTVVGIVTCGGLCPGQNDVIRSLVLTLTSDYGVHKVLGFRYGYMGMSKDSPAPPIMLDTAQVDTIHRKGGTILASSRGAPEVSDMLATLKSHGVSILFTIGGDGTLRGASAISRAAQREGYPLSVVGVPKTIDNDILWVERSFGFATAVDEARRAVMRADVEASGAWNGIGLVKLMGRQSGFIAAHATLANSDVDFCLIPELPFALEGTNSLLHALRERLETRRHAVIVVAEGAGQDLVQDAGETDHDASGNVRLKDIGLFLKARMAEHFRKQSIPVTIKYIDPSYSVRSLPANSVDSEFCLILGQHAVHAAMAGRTDLMIGYWNQCFTHVPIQLAVEGRKQVNLNGDVWQAVLGDTRQPSSMR